MTLTSECSTGVASARLPDFMIVGAAKCGTTTLYDEIGLHPSTMLPANKEPSILQFAKTAEDAHKLYNRHFANVRPGMITGEASTAYTQFPQQKQVAGLAKDVFQGRCKIIYCVRNPIDRIRSHLLHDLAVGRLASDNIEKTVLSDSRYVSWTDYYTQIRPWIDAFGHDNVLCISLEKIKTSRDVVMEQVWQFLDLPPPETTTPPAVSNTFGTLQTPRLKMIETFQHSRVYNTFLSGLMPSGLKALAKKTLFQQHVPEAFEFSDDLRKVLEERTTNAITKLQTLSVQQVI